jgi:hypothetical protein
MMLYWFNAYAHVLMYMLEFSGPAQCVKGYHYDLGHWVFFSFDSTVIVTPVGSLKRERKALPGDTGSFRVVSGVPALWCDNLRDETFTCTSKSCF